APQHAPGGGDVAVHGHEQLVDGGELDHLADMVDEVDGGQSSVQVGGLVQHERLHAAGGVPERRVGPDGDRARVAAARDDRAVHRAVVEDGEPPGVHAVDRHGGVFGEVEVGGRIPEVPPPATGTVDHDPGDAVGSAEDLG